MSEGTSLAIPFHFQFEHCCLTLTSFEPASVVCLQDVSQKQVPGVKYMLGKAALSSVLKHSSQIYQMPPAPGIAGFRE